VTPYDWTPAAGHRQPIGIAAAGLGIRIRNEGQGRATVMPHRLVRYGGPLIAVALFAAALWVLHRELAGHNLGDIVAALRAIPASALLGAFALTVLSYLALIGYDFLALRYLGRSLSSSQIGLASFSGFTFSHSLGLGLLTGGSVRYRLYTAYGLSAGEVAELVAFVTFTFGLGFVALIGLWLSLDPGVFTGLAAPAALRAGGWFCLGLTAAYLLVCGLRRTPVTIRGWQLQIPRLPLAIGQIALSCLDWALAGAVLYLLLPQGAFMSFGAFLGAFLLATAAGAVSHVPGGLGVFESVMLLLAPEHTPTPAILSALLAYRVIYYLLPLAAAVMLLAAEEIGRAGATIERIRTALGRWALPLVPQALALTVFLGGIVLLFSGAMPASGSRLKWLDDAVALPLIETSHFLGSIVGAALLVLARGLQRRLDAAYYLSLALLSVGMAVSLLKGLDYEEAVVLAIMAAALWPCRRAFYRRASLIEQSFTPGWTAAIAIVLLASGWLGLFSHREVAYAHELWWQFALDSDAPRTLRATTGATAIALVFALVKLLHPAPPEPGRPTAAEVERAAALAAGSVETSAWLAALGDKALLFASSGPSFLMYAVSGRSWISMGDPVGREEDHLELVWRFRELSDRHAGWTVFYQVSAARLPIYLDLGLSLLKLGEEARVPLCAFSLQGGARKSLRQIHARLARQGLAFEVQPPAAVPALLPELAAVSDAWLADKNVREKGFSLGFFQADYLARFPIALVKQGDRIVAFANLWPGAGKHELSIDLMRHLPDAPHGVMDFLFVELMLWGQAFNLGMAPLSGLEDRPLAPAWHRVSRFIYRHGEHFYNFQGLRQYKEKFDPVWEPRYLASPGGLILPRILADLALLIGGGLRGMLAK
jgi:phosphatidylglycerol lysyltransferase